MGFDIGALLGIVQTIAGNPTVQKAAIDVAINIDQKIIGALNKSGHTTLANIAANTDFQQTAVSTFAGIGQKILGALRKGDHVSLQSIGMDLATNAPALVGAIVKGTSAEHLVKPEIVAVAKTRIDRETQQFG